MFVAAIARVNARLPVCLAMDGVSASEPAPATGDAAPPEAEIRHNLLATARLEAITISLPSGVQASV
jgi:hypothetical protein